MRHEILTSLFLVRPLGVLLLCLGLNACSWNINEPLSWDVDLVAPFATSTISLEDVISDSTLLTEDSSQTLVLLLRDTLVNVRLEEIIEIPDTSYIQRFDLQSFRLGDQAFSEQITLATIARTLSDQGNILGDIILLSHGGVIPTLPEVSGLSSGAVPVDASSLFETALLETGEIEIVLTNELPVAINNVSFEVRNQQAGNQLFSGFIATLPSGGSEVRTYDVSGFQVEATLEAFLLNLDVPESSFVPIDTLDFIEFAFTAKNLIAREATAIFPSQTVDSSFFPFIYTFTGQNAGVEIQRATIESGNIEAKVVSTLGDTVEVIYRLPSANLNGEIPEVIARLDPASPTQNFVFSQNFDLSGYELDFSQGGTTANTLSQFYQINLIYSGNLVSIDQADSVFLEVALQDIKASSIEGYFGTGSLDYTGTEAFSALGDIQVDQLNLVNPEVRLIFENSLGINLEGTVRSLSARNSSTPIATTLSSTLFAEPFFIPGPESAANPGVVTSTFTFTPQNSNIPELIQLLPNQLSYDVQVTYNPLSGQIIQPENFATSSGSVLGIVEFELPLNGSLSGLVFQDTSALSFSFSEDTANLNSGALILQFENGFPLDVLVNSAVVDERGFLVEVLAENAPIDAALVDEAGIVTENVSSEIRQDFSKTQLKRIIERGQALIFQYRISSQPQNQNVRMRSDYQVVAHLVGAFNFQLNP
ncbi:MAG: hypothetical protein AAF694_18100 [Bacteroidota bacterium]